MRRFAVAVAVLFLGADAACAEDLTIALSTPEVRIDSNFTGTTITAEASGDAFVIPAATAFETFPIALLVSTAPDDTSSPPADI